MTYIKIYQDLIKMFERVRKTKLTTDEILNIHEQLSYIQLELCGKEPK